MRKFKFAKLVRDKIVENITAGGNKLKWKILSQKEYLDELKNKILEEAEEIPKTDKKELVIELADIQEIIDNLLRTLKVNKREFTEIQRQKNKKAGSFKKRHYIDYAEVKEDSKWIEYYLKNPNKYPEIKS